MSTRVRVAVAGCGTIANIMHLPGLATMREMGLVEIVAACDVAEPAVRAAAERFTIPGVYTELETMLARADFELLINCTRIPDHFDVTRAALLAGRHVYTQKPMTLTVDEATTLIELARRQGRVLAVHPEHPVRPLMRTMRRLVADGAIGKVAFANVRSSHGGPETHDVPRDSTWFYQPGSSPILDMGVHGLSQITAVLGPVRRLACLSGRTVPERVHTAGPFKGKAIPVNIDDSSLLLLDFGEATFGYLDATYNVPASQGPQIEIYGSQGTLSVSRRGSEAELQLYRSATDAWETVTVPEAPPVRDLGSLHLVRHLRGEEGLILTAEHGRHLVEIMATAPRAAATGRTIELTTTF